MTGAPTCDTVRPFLGAIADGRDDLVPEPARIHLSGCSSCSAEADAHRLLTRRLRQALAGATPAGHRVRRPVAAAGALVAVAAVAAVAFATWKPPAAAVDPRLAAAVTAGSRPAQYESSDAAELGEWCDYTWGTHPAVIALPASTPRGVRIDEAPARVATVTYTDGVRVAWLLDAPPAGEGVARRDVKGVAVEVVDRRGREAVVFGTVPADRLERVAAELFAALDQAPSAMVGA